MDPPHIAEMPFKDPTLAPNIHHVPLIVQIYPGCQEAFRLCVLERPHIVSHFLAIPWGQVLIRVQKGDPLIPGFADGEVLRGRKIINPGELVYDSPHLSGYFHGPVRRAGVHHDLLRHDPFSPGEGSLYVRFLILYDHTLGDSYTRLSHIDFLFSLYKIREQDSSLSPYRQI